MKNCIKNSSFPGVSVARNHTRISLFYIFSNFFVNFFLFLSEKIMKIPEEIGIYSFASNKVLLDFLFHSRSSNRSLLLRKMFFMFVYIFEWEAGERFWAFNSFARYDARKIYARNEAAQTHTMRILCFKFFFLVEFHFLWHCSKSVPLVDLFIPFSLFLSRSLAFSLCHVLPVYILKWIFNY